MDDIQIRVIKFKHRADTFYNILIELLQSVGWVHTEMGVQWNVVTVQTT